AAALGRARGLPRGGRGGGSRGVREDAGRRGDEPGRGRLRRRTGRARSPRGAALPHAAHRAGHTHAHRPEPRAPAPPGRPEPGAFGRSHSSAAPQGPRHSVMRRRSPAPRPATLIPGDGIGPEVTDAVVQVVEAAGGRIAWDVQIAGKTAFDKLGTAIPDALLA